MVKIPHMGDTLFLYADSSTNTMKCNPIRNTSFFLRLHAGTINESNPEQLLVFKAPRVGTIDKSNPEQLLVFKAPHGDNQRIHSRTSSHF